MLLRYFHTIRHLSSRQIFYRFYYPLKKKFYKASKITSAALSHSQNLPSVPLFAHTAAAGVFSGNSFTFLNKEAFYPGKINWNEAQHGLLWTFHLNYFDWLDDDSLTWEERFRTVEAFTTEYQRITWGRHIYPSSRRVLNWIRFMLRYPEARSINVLDILWQDAMRISFFPEFDLSGNHLLENGLALYAAGIFFGERRFQTAGKKILSRELIEQVLNDGGHFERSAAYHTQLLWRLMQCIEMGSIYKQDPPFLQMLRDKAELMLGWITAISSQNGSVAHFGDSNDDMLIPVRKLVDFADHLSLKVWSAILSDSGYRKIVCGNMELVANVGNIAANYQPGHSHADALSFVLWHCGKEIIVDTGVSTYEADELRQEERSSPAHNTISIRGRNVHDVWRSFRVGRRTPVIVGEDRPGKLSATIKNYAGTGLDHNRSFFCEGEKIRISDKISGKKNQQELLKIHFHPDISLIFEGENIRAGSIVLKFEQILSISLRPYFFAVGFNKRIGATCVEISVANEATISIEPIAEC